MTQERLQTVIRRKAEAGRPAASGTPLTAERAIGQALSKVAQDMFALPLQVLAISEGRRSLADMPEALEPLSLIALIEGPEEGLGILALPPETLSVLLEVQTMGTLAKAAPPPRKPTRIDASMVADFLDTVLAGIEESLAETEAVVWAGGFRYASYLDDPRPLGLLLEDIGYRLWQVEMGFGAGAERRGKLVWAVPVNGRGQALRRWPGMTDTPTGPGPGAATLEVQKAAEWQSRLQASVMGAAAQIDAVLDRVSLPLSAVLRLRPGMSLPISADALENLTLEGAGRRRLATARLGQHRGQRAVRLTETERAAPDLEDMAEPKARLVVPPPFEPGASPFAGKAPARGPRGPLDRIDSPAYDPPAPAEMGGMGGLGGLDDLSGDLPPLGMALDGFGAALPEDDLPPLRVGAGF